MRTQTVVIAVLFSGLAACAKTTTTSPTLPGGLSDFSTLHAAGKIELLEEGGIAAIAVHRIARYEDRYFLYTLGHLCSGTCTAALDSASGTLTQAAADSLFNSAFGAGPFALKDDYGTTQGAADMLTYTLRVTFGSDTKTIRADDGSMPPPMRQIVDAMHEKLSAVHR